MVRKSALTGLVLAVVLLAASVAARAQTEAASPARPVPPYAGFINTDMVNIRSGPGLYYYPLATAAQNAPVVVESETRDWLGLRPLAGVSGLVAEADVTLSADGKTATVASPTARVYASSPSAKRQWCVTMVKKGTMLQVASPPQNGLVRVAPPEESRVYVLAQYVTPIASAAVPPGGAAVVSIAVEPPTADPQAQTYKDAGAALAEELRKPMLERDYGSIQTRFADVAEKAEKDWLKSAAERQVSRIEGLKRQQQEFQQTVAIADRLDARMTELGTARAEAAATAQRDAAMERPAFQATGVVKPWLTMEDEDYPAKHILVDTEGRPVVILQSDRYNLDEYIGKAVGVRGTRTYIAGVKTYLVTVDDLEVLE
ncbi:MAG: hypothetical protein WBD63_05065 [Phycisphaerae bacterium]|nr:hypothetical protein [Phycisphaerae bacterium]